MKLPKWLCRHVWNRVSSRPSSPDMVIVAIDRCRKCGRFRLNLIPFLRP